MRQQGLRRQRLEKAALAALKRMGKLWSMFIYKYLELLALPRALHWTPAQHAQGQPATLPTAALERLTTSIAWRPWPSTRVKFRGLKIESVSSGGLIF